MSFGPEFIWYIVEDLKKYIHRRVYRIDGGDNCVVITFAGNIVLLLSWGAQSCGIAQINESEKKSIIENSKQIPPIVNILKSQLMGAEFTFIEQVRRDRMLKFEFKKTVGAGFTNTRFLILETMERYSNLVITDANNVIIETAKHIHPSDNAYRSVLPGQMYVLPPEFTGISLEQWLSSPDMSTLSDIAGFGRKLIKILETQNLIFCKNNLSRFYISNDQCCMVPQAIGSYITVFPTQLTQAKTFTGANEICRAAVLDTIISSDSNYERKKILDFIKHAITRRERQTKDINELLNGEDIEEYQRRGNLILANIWQIKQKSSKAEISYIDSNCKNITETLTLDPTMTPSQNASALFAKYKKISAARARAAKILATVQAELCELNEQLAIASCIEDYEGLNQLADELGIKESTHKQKKHQQQTKLPPHKRFDLGYAIILAGLSAKGNRYVTFKIADSSDIWFHVQGIPGSHVILRYTTTPTEDEKHTAIAFCASLAAYFSKGRENKKQRVDFTQRKFVSPIRGGLANVTYKEFESITADASFWQEYIMTLNIPTAMNAAHIAETS